MGMHLLQKMGWKPGEGLGKEKNGSLQPLLLEVKLDKKGLVADEEVTFTCRFHGFIISIQAHCTCLNIHRILVCAAKRRSQLRPHWKWQKPTLKASIRYRYSANWAQNVSWVCHNMIWYYRKDHHTNANFCSRQVYSVTGMECRSIRFTPYVICGGRWLV